MKAVLLLRERIPFSEESFAGVVAVTGAVGGSVRPFAIVAGPVTVRDVARRVGRDAKPVHTDLAALLKAGVLDKTEGGQVAFPYESVKVEFMLQAA